MTGWAIEDRDRNTSVMRRLGVHNRRDLGLDVPAADAQALDAWIADMADVGVVLDYHPEAPPNDACRTGGFFYRLREATDATFFRRHPAAPA